MKRIERIIFIILLIRLNDFQLIAQLDTTIYFPLKVGNYWEYWSTGTEVIPWFIWVTGDTLMDNGKQYFKLKNVYDYSDGGYNYYRLDSLKNLYQYIIRPDCIEKDELLYNFVAEDSSMWPICGNINPIGPYFYGIFQTTINYYPIFNSSLRSKWFTSVLIDTTVTPPDTLWDPIYGGPIGVRKIAKGVGMAESIAELGPHFFLTGAIIDSNKYGTISGLEDEDLYKNLNQDVEIDVYPNPFNNSTTIILKSDQKQNVNVDLIDILGNRTKTILNDFILSDKYMINIRSDDISSGIYFLIVKYNSRFAVKKLIIIK